MGGFGLIANVHEGSAVFFLLLLFFNQSKEFSWKFSEGKMTKAHESDNGENKTKESGRRGGVNM